MSINNKIIHTKQHNNEEPIKPIANNFIIRSKEKPLQEQETKYKANHRIFRLEPKKELQPELKSEVDNKIIRTRPRLENNPNDDYVPTIDTNTVIEYKTDQETDDSKYLKHENYLSEFFFENEKAEARKNLNIKDTKYLVDPSNHPYELDGKLINVLLALNDLFTYTKTPIDLSTILYSKEGLDVTNAKEALDDLYNGSGSTNDPTEHPYTHEGSNVTNVKEALDELYSTSITEVDASLVTYEFEGKSFKNVKEALDSMFYTNININSFSVYPSEAEVGDTIAKVTFKWSYNKSNITLKLDNIVIDPSIRENIVENVTKNISKTLYVTDGTTSQTRTASVYFKYGSYYGTLNLLPTSLEIVTKFKRNLNLKVGSKINVNAASGEYIYIMVPQSLKNIKFKVGGFEGGFHVAEAHFKFNRYNREFDNVLFVSDEASLGATEIIIA